MSPWKFSPPRKIFTSANGYRERQLVYLTSPKRSVQTSIDLTMPSFRPVTRVVGRSFISAYSSSRSCSSPRHLLSISDLKPSELIALIQNAAVHKAAIKSSIKSPFRSALQGQAVGMIFQKRSTRTRVSTEGAVVAMGGHPIFLGKQQICISIYGSDFL
jgi:ornithine carbamoyltransferase